MLSDAANWTVVTGSTGGIGTSIVQQLAARGNSLVLLNRSEAKANAQKAKLIAEYPDQKFHLVTADLMDTGQISAAILEMNALPGRIDALYNNSGVLAGNKVLNEKGIEMHFAVNLLAPYLLTLGLRKKMARASGDGFAMVVNFSSSAITSAKKLDLNTMANPDTIGGLLSTYAQTKLAVTALAPALAEDLRTNNILIRAIDPGATKTAMTTGRNTGMPLILRWLAPLLFSPAEKQAAKIIASADPATFDGATGIYVANLKKKKLPSTIANKDVQLALLSVLNDILDTA